MKSNKFCLSRCMNCEYCTKEFINLQFMFNPLILAHKVIAKILCSFIPKLTEQKVASLQCCNKRQLQ